MTSGALNSYTIETANLIYAAQQKNKGQTVNAFTNGAYEKAFMMAAGGTTIEGLGFDKEMGGFDEDSRWKFCSYSTLVRKRKI